MALPKLLEDLAFISKLGDYPGSDDNLTPEQFRERFDAAALRIQEYLNNQLIPGLDQLVDVQALLNGILDPTLSLADKAANAKATGDALGKKLDKTGGNVTGNIDMGGKKITNLATPTANTDASTKAYVDGKYLTCTATLNSSNWSSSAPYTQKVTVSGILASDMPHISPVYSSTLATAMAQKEAWEMVSKATASSGAITFTCFEDKPTTNIPVQIEVNR